MIPTTLAIILFLLVGIALGYREGGWIAVGDRILNRKILIAITVYFPWALLQQMLFQFYLLGRVRVLWPSLHPLSHATLNGLAFALVHLPDIWIALMTALGGTVWSFLYIRYRLCGLLLFLTLLWAQHFTIGPTDTNLRANGVLSSQAC
jgi:hypothetical protein